MAITKAAFTEDCGWFATPLGLPTRLLSSGERLWCLRATYPRYSKRQLERGFLHGQAFLSLKSSIL